MNQLHRFGHAARAALVSCIGLSAAGALHAQVGVTEVDSAVPEQRMTLAPNETFEQPLPSADNALPEYPPAMMQLRLAPMAVCVRVSIDEKGKVDATAPIGVGPDCPAESNAPAEFYEAAEQATGAWKYEPAFRCIYPKGQTPPKRGCWGDKVKEVPEAVSLVYRFVFEQVDGQGLVRFAD